jgi:hypothetical protein
MLRGVNSEGRIRSIDEYYNTAWDEGAGEHQYTVMKGFEHQIIMCCQLHWQMLAAP